MDARPFTIQDFDRFIDEKAINNLHRFAKTVENIFTNELQKPVSSASENVDSVHTSCTKGVGSDVAVTEDSYIIFIDLPGVEKESIVLNVSNSAHQLHMKVERKLIEGLDYIRRERKFGVFTKTLTLPKDANLNSVDAKYENGVLRVTVKKHVGDATEVRNVAIH
jgi:HSP20 family protein